MNTPTPGVTGPTPPVDTTPGPVAPFDGALVPFPREQHTLPGLPTPTEVRKLLSGRIDEAIGYVRQQRGAITVPEDVHPLVRSVFDLRELIGQYVAVLNAIVLTLTQVLEEELIEGVGEQAGVPNGPMSVPTARGTSIRITPKTKNVHDVDTEQVIACVAARAAEEWTARIIREPDTAASPSEQPEQFAMDVVRAVLDMLGASAKFKVTAVKALAAEFSVQGHTQLAGTVASSIVTRKVLDKVAIEETTPKSR